MSICYAVWMDILYNSAYIDGSNLYQGMKDLGWNLDYKKFRIWLTEKYVVSHAYIFLGYTPQNEIFYKYLKDSGYILIFKEIVCIPSGKIKGNCDAELILNLVNDFHGWKFVKAVLVTSDGDFACVAKFLFEFGAFFTLISPRNKCSLLLKKLPISITYLNTQKNNLEEKVSHI